MILSFLCSLLVGWSLLLSILRPAMLTIRSSSSPPKFPMLQRYPDIFALKSPHIIILFLFGSLSISFHRPWKKSLIISSLALSFGAYTPIMQISPHSALAILPVSTSSFIIGVTFTCLWILFCTRNPTPPLAPVLASLPDH